MPTTPNSCGSSWCNSGSIRHRGHERSFRPGDCPADDRSAPRFNRCRPSRITPARTKPKVGDVVDGVPSKAMNSTPYPPRTSRAADSTSVFEHCLKIERRAADDLEHVGGGGLLLQRFAQLAEQPRVLDGDDGLGGEVRHQRNLLVGERAHLWTVAIRWRRPRVLDAVGTAKVAMPSAPPNLRASLNG